MNDEYGGEEGLGLVRGVLHKYSNSWEGKCYNSFKRSGLSQMISFSDALRNLADYIDNPTVEPKYIYYSEAPKVKRKKLGKREYNKVIKHYFKVYPKRKKLPKKTKYLTKAWEHYILRVNNYIKSLQSNKQKKKGK